MVHGTGATPIGPDMNKFTGMAGVSGTANTVSIKSTVSNTNKAALTKLRTLMSRTHYYYVSFEYNAQGLVACVHIGYSSGDESVEVHDDTTWYTDTAAPTPTPGT